MEKQLLHPLNKRIRCEVYACKKIASYSIGHPAVKTARFHICEDCLKEVLKEAGELFGEKPENAINEVDIQIESENNHVETPYESTAEVSDSRVEGEKNDTGAEVPEGEENPSEKEEENFECKYCGKTFTKNEKMKYVGHVNHCPENPKNKKESEDK